MWFRSSKYIQFQYAPQGTGSPGDLSRPHDHATTAFHRGTPVSTRPRHARPPRSSPRSHRRMKGRRRRTRRAGGVERCPRGDGLFGPRERRESPGREEFHDFCVRVWVAICTEGIFFGDRTLSSLPDDFIFASPFCGSAVERSTLYAQVPGSSPMVRPCSCCFELYGFGYGFLVSILWLFRTVKRKPVRGFCTLNHIRFLSTYLYLRPGPWFEPHVSTSDCCTWWMDGCVSERVGGWLG